MHMIKNLLLGARLSPVMLAMGLSNLALGLLIATTPPDAHASAFSGLWNIFICLWVAYVIVKDASRVNRAAEAFRPLLTNASPRNRTRLLVGLRVHAEANRIGLRRASYIAGVGPKDLDSWTAGREATITAEEEAKVRESLRQQAELDRVFAKLNKGRRTAFVIACLVAPLLSGTAAYLTSWPVWAAVVVPVPALALYWWSVFAPPDAKRRRVSVLQREIFGKEIPAEIQKALAPLVIK